MKRFIKLSVVMSMLMMLCSADINRYTRLTITVIDNIGNHIEGATVKIYKTQEDFDALENEVASDVSNRKGKVYFKELEPIAYFVYAEKDAHNNIGHGDKTSVLTKNHHNKANVIVSE